MRLLYLDIDGVLNDHRRHTNGYCGLEQGCVERLNSILSEAQDLQLVISSAWRYLVLGNAMNLRGFEALLLSHGLCCHERLFGITPSDEEYLPPCPTAEDYKRNGCSVRGRQITEHLDRYDPDAYAVLDDMEVPVKRLVRTDGNFGLQERHIEEVLFWLREPLK